MIYVIHNLGYQGQLWAQLVFGVERAGGCFKGSIFVLCVCLLVCFICLACLFKICSVFASDRSPEI